MTKIGLGMAVYNGDRFLHQSIDSIRSQSFSGWELHVVDDGSTDQTWDICLEYAAIDDRIKIHQLGENKGNGSAMVEALSFISAPYLGWVDADDLLEPDALRTTLEWMRINPGCDLVYTDYLDIDLGGAVLGLGGRCKSVYSPLNLLVDFMVFHFRLMKTEAYREVGGFNPEIKAAADYEFILRASERLNIEHMPIPLYRYRKHPSSLSGSLRELQVQESRDAIEKAIERRGLNCRLDTASFRLIFT